jgi:hypothetical protein
MFFKSGFFFVLMVSIICFLPSCGEQCKNTKEFAVPQVSPADADGWESYSTPVVLNEDTVDGLAPGTGSPEAAVVHFFASKIRGDSCFNDVIPKDKEKYSSAYRILERIKDWKFLEVTLLERKKRGTERYWIKVKMKIEIEGDIDSGTDEATVRQIDGKWYVTRPPA